MELCRYSVLTQQLMPTLVDTNARWQLLSIIIRRYEAVEGTYASVRIAVSTFDGNTPSLLRQTDINELF
jgi:hypothetical protein